MSAAVQSVQCFGKKKTATAVAHCKQGKGLVKVNGKPLSLVEPQILRFKVYEPLLILGLDKFGTLQTLWRGLKDWVPFGRGGRACDGIKYLHGWIYIPMDGRAYMGQS